MRLVRVLIWFLLVGFVTPSFAAKKTDVFFIYSLKDKKAVKDFLNEIPKGVSLTEYKADLLAMADYSGKQKLAAQAESSRVVALYGDLSQKLLKGVKFNQPLLVIDSATPGPVSDEFIIYVVSDTATLKLLGKFETLNKEKESLVKSLEKLKGVAVFRIKKDKMFNKEAATLVKEILSAIS